MSTDFIMMLTHDDATVPDAAELLEEIAAAGVAHIGFKDIGLPFSTLRELAKRIKDLGATSYLEVVSESADDERRSVEAALELGVDYLLGGTHVRETGEIIAGSHLRYYPFPGRIVGHPSVLSGTADEIVASAREHGGHDFVDGLDLLAYRFDGDVVSLMGQVVAAAGVPVIVAGSVNSAERIAAVVDSGAQAFTIGSALIDGSLAVASADRTPDGLSRAVLELIER